MCHFQLSFALMYIAFRFFCLSFDFCTQIVAVIVCDTGIALLAYMDGSYSRTLGTVVLAAGAACGASIYKVSLDISLRGGFEF